MIRWITACLLVPVLASAQQGFQLPSGNIHCRQWEGSIRCDILQSAYKRPPRPADCELEYGDSVELGPRGRAQLVCHGDTVQDPKSPVLGYGRAWQGSLFVGSLKFRYLARLEIRDGRVVKEEKLLQHIGQRIRDVREGPDGLLYVLTDASPGQLLRLAPGS